MGIASTVQKRTSHELPPYPWQEAQWQALKECDQQGRLHHALLLSGQQGLGKLEFAYCWAKSLLCESKQACGQCKSCQLIDAGTHPDLYELLPEEPGKAIKVDQVRQLHSFIYKTAQLSGYRIALIAPADAMNTAASNALLKSLEEPGKGVQLILVSDNSSRLLPTIKSRCQQLNWGQPSASVVQRWLQQHGIEGSQQPALLAAAHQSPLRAKEFASKDVLQLRQQALSQWQGVLASRLGPVSTAAIWMRLDSLLLLGWVQSWALDLMRMKAGSEEQVDNVDLHDDLLKVVDSLSDNGLCLVAELLLRLREDFLSSNNLNKQSLWERFLITCQQLTLNT